MSLKWLWEEGEGWGKYGVKGKGLVMLKVRLELREFLCNLTIITPVYWSKVGLPMTALGFGAQGNAKWGWAVLCYVGLSLIQNGVSGTLR